MIYIGQIDVVNNSIVNDRLNGWIDMYICWGCRANRLGWETTNIHFVINDRFACSTRDLSALHVDHVTR